MNTVSGIGHICALKRSPGDAASKNIWVRGLTCKLKVLWEGIWTTETTLYTLVKKNRPMGCFSAYLWWAVLTNMSALKTYCRLLKQK